MEQQQIAQLWGLFFAANLMLKYQRFESGYLED
jgi:hypothetical protein